jgi:choline kinase/mannose-6-phosphate isomerase-like protein (cupin superfamily)
MGRCVSLSYISISKGLLYNVFIMSFDNNKYINKGRIVLKPWGREIWLELNDKYCYKRIEIKGGFKTSFQLHNFKLETNYIIQGQAEVWLENDEGVVETFQMNEGDYFTVLPGRKHRVIAITDVILQEVSTPEVDDVIRINDEFNRTDGKVSEEHCKPVVCILAAGTGSRLGDLGKDCPKCLLPFKNKALLSYIIEKFSKEFDIVIAVGYLKEQIKEYVSLYHSDINIQFVDVDPYEGVGSGPARSIESCREFLQRPFYFCVSDFYTSTNLQNTSLSTKNWIGLAETETPSQYSTVRLENEKITHFMNKDTNGYKHAFTGIFYMYDYKLFWNEFDKNVTDSKEIVDVFKDVTLFQFEKKDILWNDVGTLELYDAFLSTYETKNLYLHNTKHEHKYKTQTLFIKKIDTPGKLEKLFERAEHFKSFLPDLSRKGKYFLSYKYIEGETLYKLNKKEIYLSFLDWFDTNFMKVETKKTDIDRLAPYALAFYKDKSYNRLHQFKKNPIFEQLDAIRWINGIPVKPIESYLERLPWDTLLTTIPTRLFHGDLQFDNIIYNNTITLIDWREDFGGTTEFGDLCYDLAKLYGGMELNYNVMKDPNSFHVNLEDETATFTHHKDEILQDIQQHEFLSLLERNAVDKNKIKLLVAIIFLNMAPLHINNFDRLLFLKCKLLFEEVLTS